VEGIFMADGRKSIRKIDRDVYREIRVIAVWHAQPVGQIITEALRFYLDHCPEDNSHDSPASR
jgi:hypothetical protein